MGFRGQFGSDHRLPEAGWSAPAALGPQGVRVALLLACTLAVYVPVFGAGYLWDDDIYVRSNSALRSLSGLWDIWRIPPATRQYYPVTYTSFWREHRIWGDGPLGYHVVNLVLHAANALLVWPVLAALGGPAAFAAAAQTNPRFAAAYNNWGDALREQGRFDEAADRYARALARNRPDPIARTDLGIVMHRRRSRTIAGRRPRRSEPLRDAA